jgi:hypothetical protein
LSALPDYHDNVYALIQGQKRLQLFGPDDTPNLYPNGELMAVEPSGQIHYNQATEGRQHFSQLPSATWADFTPPQREQFPGFAEARPMFCDITAGDLLYIPTGWWHEVTSFGQHIALNFWAEAPTHDEMMSFKEKGTLPDPPF